MQVIRISSSKNFRARKKVPSSNLNKRILRFILDDFESTYNILLDQVDCVSLNNRRTHDMLILHYMSLFLIKYPIYMTNMFNLRISSLIYEATIF